MQFQKKVLLSWTIVNLIARRGGGGGGGEGAPPTGLFQFFSGMEGTFIPNKIFTCCLIILTSFHYKIFQIRPTNRPGFKIKQKEVAGGGWGGGGVVASSADFFLTYFSNHEDDIQS